MMKKLSFIACLSLSMLVMGNHQNVAAQTPQEPDTILFNGKIVTVDSSFNYAQAIAIAGERILAVGSDADIRKLAGSATRQLDLHSKTVIPGLSDNHLHGVGGGPGVDLSRVETLHELLEAIQASVLASNPGDLIVSNSDWHEAQLKEQRLPLRRDLDTVSPENPVVVVRGGHEYILNSMALRKWEINENTPIPDGLTSVRHPGGSVEQFRLLQEMERRGLLTMRVNFLIRLGGVKTPQEVE